MSQYPPSMGNPQQPEKPKKGWFGRNWMWFIPVVVLLPIICCCGGGLWMAKFGADKLMEMAPYKDTIAQIQQDKAVQDALGTPITVPEGLTDLAAISEEGGEFNVNQNNSTTEFDAKIPVSGPKGKGMLVIKAKSTDGSTWTYTTRQIELDNGKTIDLLKPATPKKPDAADGSQPPTP